jgi:large repetitive protein
MRAPLNEYAARAKSARSRVLRYAVLPLAFLVLPIGLASCRAQAASTAEPSGGWQRVETAERPMQRHENGYVAVGDLFYLIGGRGERPVEVFDPATGSWETRATAPLEMHHFQAVEYDGRIYVLGALTGGYPNEDPIPHVYIYDPAADHWSRGPEIPADRRRGAAGVVVHEGRIYLVSGIQNGHSDGHVPWLDAFDPRTGEWEQLPDSPRARDHFHAAVVEGRLYAAGGRRSSAATGEPFQLTIPEVDVYDFASRTWSTLPAAANLPTERAGTAAAVLQARLVVLGGESGSQQPAHAEVEAFDPRTGRWELWPPMLEGRHGTQAIAYDGRIYIAAGSKTRGADEIDSQEVFTPGR